MKFLREFPQNLIEVLIILRNSQSVLAKFWNQNKSVARYIILTSSWNV